MSQEFLIVSNRLPVVIKKDEGEWKITPGAGGLVTALKPVLSKHGGSWIGWPGETDDAPVDSLLGEVGRELGCRLHPVSLSSELVEGYYFGFSNETLWPLFHDLLGHAKFELDAWKDYVEANGIFADAIAQKARPDQVLWIHDYQLMLTGEELRRREIGNPIGFFLHIPFPSPDIYSRLPWRTQLLEALLHYDLVGFQTKRDLRNFVHCLRRFLKPQRVRTGRKKARIEMDGRRVLAGYFPISIDFEDFDRRARSEEVREAGWYIHEGFREQKIILGADRLDYTKGIPARFRAFARALEKYPDLHRKVSMIQLLVPSREQIDDYAAWKEQLERLSGEINGRFASRGWVPLHYMYRALPFQELLGHYRTSEICLVTSLKDGMNLVAKEYAACSVDENGVLILSEFAGAAPQMKGALIVNPHDQEQVADAIYQAFNMPEDERVKRMRALRRGVARNNVFKWVDSFLDELTGIDPSGQE
ncbi:MAG TPA: trehalose-6-phosphate synthase [Acidobacteriota bacterium]|nr:trehalose-6-phosphate synthase [Acidobacteriota bacterium]